MNDRNGVEMESTHLLIGFYAGHHKEYAWQKDKRVRISKFWPSLKMEERFVEDSLHKKFKIEIWFELPPSFVSLAIARSWHVFVGAMEDGEEVNWNFSTLSISDQTSPPFLSMNLNEVIRLVKWANHPLLVKWPTRGEKLTQSKSLPFDAGL